MKPHELYAKIEGCHHVWHLYKDCYESAKSVTFICDKCGVYKSTAVTELWLHDDNTIHESGVEL